MKLEENRTMTTPIHKASEEGSAYIITLMVVFILTIVGLSLTLITQTEVLVGQNERTVERIFYAADSGVGVAVARALVYNDHQPSEYRISSIKDVEASGAFNREDAITVQEGVAVSPFVPILSAPCNLCQINQGNEFFEINHAVTSTATRTAAYNGTTGQDVPMARKAISAMVEIQPWRQSADAFYMKDSQALSEVHM